MLFVSRKMLTFLQPNIEFSLHFINRSAAHDLGHLQLMVVHQRWVYYDQKSPDSDFRRSVSFRISGSVIISRDNQRIEVQ